MSVLVGNIGVGVHLSRGHFMHIFHKLLWMEWWTRAVPPRVCRAEIESGKSLAKIRGGWGWWQDHGSRREQNKHLMSKSKTKANLQSWKLAWYYNWALELVVFAAGPWGSLVAYNHFLRAPMLDEVILCWWWSKTKPRPLCNWIWGQQKQDLLWNHKNDQILCFLAELLLALLLLFCFC